MEASSTRAPERNLSAASHWCFLHAPEKIGRYIGAIRARFVIAAEREVGEFNYLSKQPAPTNNETLFDFCAATAAVVSLGPRGSFLHSAERI